MAGGEVCFRVVGQSAARVDAPTRPDVGLSSAKECCFSLPALVNPSNTNELENDKHSLLFRYDKDYYTDVVFTLQKQESGVWVDKTIINGNLGAFYDLGQYSNDKYNYIGTEVEWVNVFLLYSDGNYRFKIEETDFSASVTEYIYPFEFCVKEYTPNRANNSVRFDFYQKAIIGDWQVDTETFDYSPMNQPNGWYNELRLPSYFGQNTSTYEREFIKYQNGNLNYIQDEQIENFNWVSGYFPAQLHQFIKTNVLQADTIQVTDFNKNNPNVISKKEVKPNSSYEPDWKFKKQTAKVNVEFVEAYQLKRKRRC